MSKYNAPRRGDRIDRILTAERINGWNRAANALKEGEVLGRDSIKQAEDPVNTVMFYNDDDDAAGWGNVRQLAEPLTSDYSQFKTRTQLKGAKPDTDSDLGKFGVFRRPISGKAAGQVAVAGVVTCQLRIPANGSWIVRADIDPNDATRLLATPNGSAQILWRADPADAATAETVDAVVRLSNPEFCVVKGKANGTITAGSTGTMRVWADGNTDTSFDIPDVHLDWMHDDQDISSGREIAIGWFPQEGLWRVLWAQCEDSGEQPTVPYNAEWGGYY